MTIGLHVSGGTSVCFVTLWLIQAVIVLLTHECSGLCEYNYKFEATITCAGNISTYQCIANNKMEPQSNEAKHVTESELDKLFANTITDGKEQNLAAVEGLIDSVATKISALNKALAEEKDPVQKKRTAKAVRDNLLRLSDVVLVNNKITPAEKSDFEKMTRIAARLLDAFESNGPLIAAALPRGTTSRRKSGSLEMILRNLDLTLSEKSASFLFKSDGFSFDIGTLKAVSDSDTVAISSVLFNDMNRLLAPNDSASQILKQSDIFGTVQRFNTLVMMISVNTKTPIKRLSKNVTIIMKLQDPGLSSPVCYSLHPKTAELIPTGCTARSINATHATCSCNHLTSFVILMSVTKSADEKSTSLALDIVSYVSCSLSVLSLLLSFITFVSFAALKSDRNTIHTHLVVCLGFGQLLFLVGIDRTESKAACAVIAGALHYLFMASFCWMAMEGLELCLKLVMVFETTHTLLPLYFSIGYGVPVIIVAVAAGLFPQGYGTETSCWLSKERGFHWSFVGPALCVMAFNTINLVIALTVMCRHFKTKGGEKMQRIAQFRRSFKGASALVCIMGITWIFGPLDFADEPTAEVFAYIFIVLTGSQGLFIFIFHCVTNDQVQKQYRRALRSADWLPESCRRGLLIIVARRPSADVSTTMTRSTASSMARRQTEILDERMTTQSLSLASIPETSHDTASITDALWSTASNTTQPADGPANTAQTADSLAIAVKPADGRDTITTTDPAKDTSEIASTAEQSTSCLLSTVTNLQPTNAPADNTTSDPPSETP